ncbi:MAG TPA: phospho-N-acetylmuramoyl-pentapeptide-transferase, partial [Candidatus Omnitrophota bacterium]|nr:phospho-N-acetylmuramoyl-pentapeptide-transferase [Candidatus Omnitrophota bacterium]
MAALTAFLISLIFGPAIITRLKELKIGEKISKGDSLRLDDLHRNKKDTPTMGGLLILLAVISSCLLWSDIFNRYILIVLFSTLWLGLTGFIDDYLKQIKKRAKGLSATAKLSSQAALG